MTGIPISVTRDGSLVRVTYHDGEGIAYAVTSEAARAARAELDVEAMQPGAYIDALHRLEAEHPATEAEIEAEVSRVRASLGVDGWLPPSEYLVVQVRPCNQGSRWEAYRGTGGHMTVVRPPPEPGREPGQYRRQRGSWPTREAALDAAVRTIHEAREQAIAARRAAVEAHGVTYAPPVLPDVQVVEP